MNPQKIKEIESKVRIGGKGTPRRKKVSAPTQPNKTNVGDAKKLNAALDKCGLTPVRTITELNMYREDGTMLHFKNPQVQTAHCSNVISFKGVAQDVTLSPDVWVKVRSSEPFEVTQNNDGDFVLIEYEPIDTTAVGRVARTTAVSKRAAAVEAKKLQKGKGKAPPTATVTSSSQLLPLAVVNKEVRDNDEEVADAPVASTSQVAVNKKKDANDEKVADAPVASTSKAALNNEVRDNNDVGAVYQTIKVMDRTIYD